MSYEVVGGGMRGVGGLGMLNVPQSQCPMATSKDIPAGLSKVQMDIFKAGPQKQICGPPYDPVTGKGLDPTTVDLCNKSGMPIYCYNAKFNGMNLLGRGTAMDLALWQAWTPSASGDLVPPGSVVGAPLPGIPSLPGTPATAPGSAEDGPSTALVVGGVAVALLVVGAVVWKVTR